MFMKNMKKVMENVVNYEFIDLGLSVKWANMNVGADKVEDAGKYFAWNDVKLDEKGRMPSESEMIELVEKCSWNWINENGFKGYEVKSKINGEKIFLPAGGCVVGDDLIFCGKSGYYLSSTVKKNPIGACELVISQKHYGMYIAGLYKRSIRLVLDI